MQLLPSWERLRNGGTVLSAYLAALVTGKMIYV
jgi:hypothetical protein